VYRLAIAYVAWVYGKAAGLDGVHRAASARQTSISIPIAIAIPIPIAIAIWMK
jgi:hypothetical protein